MDETAIMEKLSGWETDPEVWLRENGQWALMNEQRILELLEENKVFFQNALRIYRENLDRFHHWNHGRICGVFDLQILQDLKETENIFVLGGIPFIYRDGVFRQDRQGAELKTMIRQRLYPECVKSTTIKRIYDLCVSDADLQVSDEDINVFPVSWIPFLNGFYDPVSRQMIPHNPKYRATVQIPHSYNPEGQEKGTAVREWINFICPDPDDQEMLIQFCGICMTRDCRQQKFLILHGVGGTGKSIVIRMIEKVIGAENVANLSLNQLTQRFSAIRLMGKLLDSCADLELDALSDVSTLKKVLGEDSISAEAKGKDPVNFKSFAKLVFSTNELPVVRSERTNGFYRRLLILTMNRIPEKRDPGFFDKLSEEIDDFIRVCVKGLERMYQDGKIKESENSISAVKRLRSDSDPVSAFLDEKTERAPEGRIKKTDAFQRFVDFCLDAERPSLSKTEFYRSMRLKGIGELKTGGMEYFRGISWTKNLPKISPQISLDDWNVVPEGEDPFAKQ